MGWLGGGGEHAAIDLAVVRVDNHALLEEGARVEAAERLEAQETIIGDVLDHEADLVHVRGEHHLAAWLRAAAALDADDVAEGIDRDLVDRCLQFGDDDRADTVFVAGDTGGFAEPLQQVEAHDPSSILLARVRLHGDPTGDYIAHLKAGKRD